MSIFGQTCHRSCLDDEVESFWSKIQQKKSPGLWSVILAPLSIGYGIGIRFRLSAYRYKPQKRKSLPGFVVSIGNLTIGGTGKTPTVIMLAKWASNEGYRVSVLSRGYRGRYKEDFLEVSDGSAIKAGPLETGDEPYLIARKLTGVPIVISRKRFKAGLFAHKKFGCNFFILDDGFQHLELKRDLDLALLDASNPFGNGHLMPWGPLREPIDQLGRADAFIITRSNENPAIDKIVGFLKEKFPSSPIFYGDHLPEKVVFPFSNEALSPEFLEGKRVFAFAGIARPESFKETLIRLGADLVYFRGYRDHYKFKKNEIQDLIKMKKKHGADYLITTEKDWVRIASFASMYPELAYLCIQFNLLSGKDDFFRMVKDGAEDKRKKFHDDI